MPEEKGLDVTNPESVSADVPILEFSVSCRIINPAAVEAKMG